MLKKIRTYLKPEEIEVKPIVVQESGLLKCLLFKTSTADRDVLDETFGSLWKCGIKEVNGLLVGSISIYDEDLKEWITREGAGIKYDTSSDKEYAADCIRQAGFQFKIGDSLFTSPEIWIEVDSKNIVKCKDNNLRCYAGLYLYVIGYDKEGKSIRCLGIKDKFNNVVYKWKHQEYNENTTDFFFRNNSSNK